MKYVCCLLRQNFFHQILVIEWLYEWVLPASISEIEIESRLAALAKQTSRRPPSTPRRSALDDYLTRHVSGANRAIGLRCIARCSSAGSCTSLRTLTATQEINWHFTHRAPSSTYPGRGAYCRAGCCPGRPCPASWRASHRNSNRSSPSSRRARRFYVAFENEIQ